MREAIWAQSRGRVKVESVKLYPVPFCPAGPISPPTLQTCRSPKLVLMLLDRLSAQSRGKKSGSTDTERWWTTKVAGVVR